jgi:microcystin-dependent protein
LGWLKCDGSWLNKSEFGLLFNVIGGTFGETSTQFRLPDPQGRVIGAVGTGSGLTPRSKGDVVGTETHTLTINEMPAHKHGSVDVSGNTNGDGNTSTSGQHSHGVNDPTHSHTYVATNANNQNVGYPAGGTSPDVNSGTFGATTSSNATGITIDLSGSHSHTMGSTGGSSAHNNIQPTLFYGNLFIYCGKVNQGAFPYTVNTDLY